MYFNLSSMPKVHLRASSNLTLVKPCFLCLMFLFLFMFSSTVSLLAQTTSSVKGKIIDHEEFTPLPKGVVMVLQAQDSILVKHGRTDLKGQFSFDSLENGNYLMYISYPTYADYSIPFSINGAGVDLGMISMKLRARLLEEVLISGIEAVIVKGDTTEFDPRAFVIEPNSKVEDLLKQFPGIQINAKGEITAQGKRVSKVLLDGEEFFGDDPTLLTRNIRGDMVQKVQLYDKKSEQTMFTGVDDGQRETTINVVTKENMRKGSFGKADAGVGNKEMYSSQGMYNSFNNKLKFSAYATLANTGRTGLTWMDSQRYGSSASSIEFLDGGMAISISGDDGDFNGGYNGSGIPKAITGGAHFNNKWRENTRSINTSYKFNQLDVKGKTLSQNQNLLPSGTLFNESNQDFDQHSIKHKLDLIYDHQIDSNSSIRLNAGVARNNAESIDNYLSKSLNATGQLLNDGNRTSNNLSDNSSIYTDILWKKKFTKPGRTFSWNLNHEYSDSHSEGNLFSTNQFYQSNGTLDSTDVIDQLKWGNNLQSKLFSRMTVTERLNRNFSVSLTYLFQYNHAVNHLQSFNKGNQGRYDQMDSLFSNNFLLNQISNQGGGTLTYNKGSHNVQVGSDFTNVDYSQTDRYTAFDFKRSFVNVSPNMYYTYRLNNNSNVNVRYRGTSRQPSINQLQPIRVNTDPLNIQLGNPTLKPSFSNSISLSNSGYKVLKNRGYHLSVIYGDEFNPIVMDRVTDSVGRSTMRSVNLKDQVNQNFGGYGVYFFVISNPGINFALTGSYNGSSSHSLVNSAVNRLNNHTYGVSTRIDYNKLSKYGLSLDLSPNYTQSVASLQKQQNNSGWNFSGSFDANVHLPFKTQLSVEGTYTYNGPTQAFSESFNQFIMNAKFAKKFFKNESLVFEVSGQDLLNQNKGFTRYASSNYIYQTQQTTLSRYFLFSLRWEFNKIGGKISGVNASGSSSNDIVF
jgi:hypothetical protein